VIRPGKLQVGYLAQDEADSLDDRTTAVTHLARLRPRDDPTRLRAHLGRFGLTQGRAETKVGNLSGGERARVLLAMASAAEPHLLIFDEPTNHLDLDSRDALVQALNAFEGAVVLISHDPHLVDLVADRLWLVADGACRPYADDLATYARSLGQVAAEGRRDRSRRKADNQRAKGTPAGASVQALKRQAETAETAVSALNRQKNELAAALADPRHHRDGSTMAQLAQQAAEVSAKLAKAEAQWLALLEQVEARADHTKTLSGRR
ncbi:MAG: ATP-binding cassette domain-containing protein, partial [Alphaproteobacteria bacterium]